MGFTKLVETKPTDDFMFSLKQKTLKVNSSNRRLFEMTCLFFFLKYRALFCIFISHLGVSKKLEKGGMKHCFFAVCHAQVPEEALCFKKLH